MSEYKYPIDVLLTMQEEDLTEDRLLALQEAYQDLAHKFDTVCGELAGKPIGRASPWTQLTKETRPEHAQLCLFLKPSGDYGIGKFDRSIREYSFLDNGHYYNATHYQPITEPEDEG